MRKKCKLLFILAFAVASLFYMDNSVVAMATEQNIEAITEPDEESGIELIVGSTESELNVESVPDIVSNGPALIEWLELHKNTGGTVKLADHVVLDGYYCYCPSGVNRPSVFVDTDKYTITVTGEIELMSDNHLTFSGQPDGGSIFYAAEKGMLSMLGVAVESGQCALWQEEGAGLVISDCHIAGSIHYADTPFVMYQKDFCVIVENGQTIDDVLPEQISCTVNRQGQLSYNELVPVTWILDETGMQQGEVQRFQMQGSFLHAASAEPVLCTVVYIVYPLTITDVKGSVSGNRYTFQGGYRLSKESLPIAVMSEKSLPITVMSEYSFDGKNWFIYEEQTVSSTYESFFIAFKSEEWDMAAHPNVYIRLQCNDNGTEYFSNMLCFAADDLEHAEDMGGSRGGGTSITNPPDQPQESAGDTSSKDEEPVDNADHNANSGNTESEVPSDTKQTEKGNADINLSAASDGQAANEEVPNADAGQILYSAAPNTDEELSLYAESEAVNAGQSLHTETKTDNNVRNADNHDIKESINRSDSEILKKKEVAAIVAAGFVLMAASAGIMGFCIHSRLGTNR